MYSLEYNYLFIRIPRTASSAIAKVLNGSKICESSHLALEDYRGVLDYSGLFKFSCVRNPWERVMSLYLWIMNRVYPDQEPPMDQFKDIATSHRTVFEFMTVDGKDMCDFYMRYDHLQEDFDIVCDKIGFPRTAIPRFNEGKHLPFSHYYNDELSDIISGRFKEEIERFGFRRPE